MSPPVAPLTRQGRIVSYRLQPGRKLGAPYEVVERLGAGTEGEVYQIVEKKTGIHRAAKLYFPHANPKGKATVWHARKLNKLRNCQIVLQYYHTQQIQVSGHRVLCLISEFVEGQPVATWTQQQPGGRLAPYTALHVLYALVRGLEEVHAVGEYHGDVHTENILVEPRGIRFRIKLLDFYNWGRRGKAKQAQDIVDSVRVFYEVLGGNRTYSKQGEAIRYICGGMQRTRILERFATMSALRLHLESFPWQRLR